MHRLQVLASFVILCAACCFAQTGPLLQRTNPNQDAKYSVSGAVVNAVTGEPVRRAMVTIFFQQQIAVLSDSNGHFEFEGLPKSSLMLTAQKPGFFNDQELSDGRKPPQMIDIGPDTHSVSIRLIPEASISGRVVDSDGLPIQHLPIRAMTRRMQEGRNTWQQAMTASTDEDGQYRIFGLKPGQYFLSAGPSQMPAFVTSGGDPMELGYPEARYPGGSANDAASAMQVNPGQQAKVNFTMRAEPFYTVSGSVGGEEEGQQFAVQLMSNSFGSQMEFASRVDPETRTFQFPRVARGDYKLMAWATDKAGKPTTASMPIHVGGNVMGVHLEVRPLLSIPVRVRIDRTRETQGARHFGRIIPPIRFLSTEDSNQQAYIAPEDSRNPESPLVLQNISPGTYRAVISEMGSLYAASARFGSTDLLTEDLTLTDSASQGQIDIVMRDDAPMLSIESPGTTRSNVQVLIVPDRGVPFEPWSVTMGTNQQTQRPIRPGSYTVLLFDDIGDVEYGNREALDPYLSRGVRVSLAPGEKKTITPELIRRGEE